ncbi:hypothetical protein BD309DRAFT_149094 [Dichomitus squalens]|nr:hypothetical protein BD309DRAFT_149094 [Dichomitus squalens]
MPSRRPNSTRLPPDGSSTVRLKEKMRNDPQIVTIIDDGDDGVSDDVQSASGFDVSDRESEAQGPVVALKSEERRATTPSGRSKIPVGLVQGNIKMFETSGPLHHRKEPPSKSKADEPVRTIDFNEMKPKSQSRKSQMKGKNQKVTLSYAAITSLSDTSCYYSRHRSQGLPTSRRMSDTLSMI